MTTPFPTRRQENENVRFSCTNFVPAIEKVKMKTLTNERRAFGVDDSTWEEVEVILLAIHYHCVSGIVAPLRIKAENISWPDGFSMVALNKSTKEDSATHKTRETGINHSLPNSQLFSSTYFDRLGWCRWIPG